MAKVKQSAPDCLRMELFAPGMSVLHRAGLGGLACTLRYIERALARGLLRAEQVPGGPWPDGLAPWEMTSQSLSLRFGAPEGAREFLRRLFGIGFDLRDDLIYLPGQYPEAAPNQAVRADLQQGLLSTFLQHGRVRGLAKQESVTQHDPEGEGVPSVTVTYRACSGYTHQDGWNAMTDEATGFLRQQPTEVSGPLSPGTVVRHVAFTADSRVENTPELLLPLYFALVGTLALPISRAVGALIVPQVEDLTEFVRARPRMTPTGLRQSQIASAADGALQAQVRLRARREAEHQRLPGCLAMTFRSTAWASQQRSRVDTVLVPPGEDLRLDRFETALAALPLRVVVVEREQASGRGRQRTVTRQRIAFRAESVVRPLVADNLARGRPWYAGFVRLMVALDDNNRPLRARLGFERGGLHEMSTAPKMWGQDAEPLLVQAVHEALRCRYGRIAEENRGKLAAMRNRFAGEYDRWRLAFAGAKTADQFRTALCDLFSRAGNNRVLREAWPSVLPMLSDQRWQLARDLSLFALASYAGEGGEEPTSTSEQEEND
jgi:CRISPR-associated protein Cas8a1/Csx13